jgi:hypothetical protein
MYATAGFLLLAAMLLFLIGPEHEISKIAAAQRAQMTDFDWIGVEWIERAFYTFLASLTCAAVAYWLRGRERRLSN